MAAVRSGLVVTADGVSIARWKLAPGAGPPLLMAHCTGFCAAALAPVAARLGGRFDPVGIDLRGHGDSGQRRGEDFDWQGFGLDVLAVVDSLGTDQRPFGFGHSCGGAALILAEQRRPGTFAGMYLFEPIVRPEIAGPDPAPAAAPLSRRPRAETAPPAGFPAPAVGDDVVEDPVGAASRTVTPPDHGLAETVLRRRRQFASFEEARANFESKAPMDRFHPEALDAYVRHGFARSPDGSVHLKLAPEDESMVYRNAGRHDAWAHLGEVNCPVVVAYGDETDTLSTVALAGIVDALPHARLEVFPGLSHHGPFERPDLVARAILSGLTG